METGVSPVLCVSVLNNYEPVVLLSNKMQELVTGWCSGRIAALHAGAKGLNPGCGLDEISSHLPCLCTF